MKAAGGWTAAWAKSDPLKAALRFPSLHPLHLQWSRSLLLTFLSPCRLPTLAGRARSARRPVFTGSFQTGATRPLSLTAARLRPSTTISANSTRTTILTGTTSSVLKKTLASSALSGTRLRWVRRIFLPAICCTYCPCRRRRWRAGAEERPALSTAACPNPSSQGESTKPHNIIR